MQCDRQTALDSFFQQIFATEVKLAWLGSGCSVATEPTAEVSHYYNMAQVSHSDAAASLVPRLLEGRKVEPDTHCLRMRKNVFVNDFSQAVRSSTEQYTRIYSKRKK